MIKTKVVTCECKRIACQHKQNPCQEPVTHIVDSTGGKDKMCSDCALASKNYIRQISKR